MCLPNDPRYDDFQSITRSVSGVIFLGTPHGGSNLAEYGMMQAKLYSMMGRTTMPGLLRPLIFDGKTHELEYLQSDFQDIQDEDTMAGLRMFYFWETKPVKIGVSLKV
jgi:hypothetical protein